MTAACASNSARSSSESTAHSSNSVGGMPGAMIRRSAAVCRGRLAVYPVDGGDSEGFMSASTASAPARPALDGHSSFESPREWVDQDGLPNNRVLTDVVQRIVQAVDPDRIVLFGSGARGTM